MTWMKKIFLNSSYKRAGYIHKSPRNKLFGTSNCKSLSILSSQSSQAPTGFTGHVLGSEAPRQLGHISPPARGRARCGRRDPGRARAGAAHVRTGDSRGAALVNAALVTMGTLWGHWGWGDTTSRMGGTTLSWGHRAPASILNKICDMFHR